MRTLLELIRIIFILAILGGIGWTVLGSLYSIKESTERYAWMGGIALFLLIFVLYRNKLQFSGWYQGKGKVMIPRGLSITLIVSSILLILLPFFLDFFS